MSQLGPKRELRLNPEYEQIYQDLYDLVTQNPEVLARWISEDRAKRGGYRNYSGRRPQLRTLLLRRAVDFGLAEVHHQIKGEIISSAQKPQTQTQPKTQTQQTSTSNRNRRKTRRMKIDF